jgi:D-glycero-alpha-D-manno-heptose-7-phosphate kinase
MIITRTPFRISFVGGGTDLASFCEKEPGAVLSTSIDKFIYVTAKKQVSIVEHKYRISSNKLELVNHVDEIEHPIIREALKMLEIDFPVEITTFADIPPQTGLGSSSVFTVGLLNALYALKRERLTKSQLAGKAAELEIKILGRNAGAQDHYAAAYGGFNVFRFYKDLKVITEPVFYDHNILKKLNSNLLLFYTKVKRDADRLLAVQSEETQNKFEVLKKMKGLVEPLEDVLLGKTPIDEFGKILHEGWMLKKSITKLISNNEIDEMYDRARAAGALGGKILGAGGGGFLLCYVKDGHQQKVIESLGNYYRLPFGFDSGGSRVMYYDISHEVF